MSHHSGLLVFQEFKLVPDQLLSTHNYDDESILLPRGRMGTQQFGSLSLHYRYVRVLTVHNDIKGSGAGSGVLILWVVYPV